MKTIGIAIGGPHYSNAQFVIPVFNKMMRPLFSGQNAKLAKPRLNAKFEWQLSPHLKAVGIYPASMFETDLSSHSIGWVDSIQKKDGCHAWEIDSNADQIAPNHLC